MLEGNEWKEISEIVCFGYGRLGKKCIGNLEKYFKVKMIIENDINKCDDVNIIHYERWNAETNNKVIVTTSSVAYNSIKEQLQSKGFSEGKDFILYQDFITEWFAKYRHKLYIDKTDILVTSYCNFNCKSCMNFIPHWKEKRHIPISEIKESLENYFRCVDFVSVLDIIGGEPFLYPELEELLIYISKNYSSKIGYLGIITNGSIMPNERLIKVLKTCNVGISISDYSKEVEYISKIEAFCEVLRENNIFYIRNSDIEWYDFGFPHNPQNFDGAEAKRHKELCNTRCRILSNSKFYYCSVQCMAVMGGLFPEYEEDSVDLKLIDENNQDSRLKIAQYAVGDIPNGYLRFCKVCGGFGSDNTELVLTGEQL